MAQSLTDFMAEMRKDLEDFERTYRESHRQDPERFPLEMIDGNEGLWFEFFSEHVTITSPGE